MSEIKNCPFCGGEAHKFENVIDKGKWFVECKECGASVLYRSENSAVKAWNTRKPMERIVERLEEMTDSRVFIDPFEAIVIVKEEGGLNE